ncbi:MAG TPA: hypothetical protein VJ739_12655 [Gemmataceae bacterium]|nr:hypothetical protein [Gemmataceae bacterium]
MTTPRKESKNRLALTALIVSILAAIFTGSTMVADWTRVASTLRKHAADEREKSQLEWSAAEVYSIIEKGSKSNPSGLDIEEIRRRYNADAEGAKAENLEIKQLSELQLRKILLDFLALKVAWQTGEDRYVLARTSIAPGGEITYALNRGLGTVLSELAKEGGRYKIEQLEPIVMEKARISREEYLIVINLLLGNGSVICDKDGRLWSTGTRLRQRSCQNRQLKAVGNGSRFAMPYKRIQT